MSNQNMSHQKYGIYHCICNFFQFCFAYWCAVKDIIVYGQSRVPGKDPVAFSFTIPLSKEDTGCTDK